MPTRYGKRQLVNIGGGMAMNRTPEEIDQAIKNAFDEIDPRQIEIFRRMSSAEKGQRLDDLFRSMRALAIASERDDHPELSEKEIWKRARARLMRMSEWEPELRERFEAWERAKEQ